MFLFLFYEHFLRISSNTCKLFYDLRKNISGFGIFESVVIILNSSFSDRKFNSRILEKEEQILPEH